MAESINLNELWHRTCQNEVAAFAQMHKKLQPELSNYLMQMAHDKHLVEDLLQNLFIKIWQKRHQLGTVANIRAYFYFASRAEFIDHYRTSVRRAHKLSAVPFHEFEPSIEDLISSREQEQKRSSAMRLAISKLSERQREMITMRYLEEMDYEHISSVTGIKYQSVVNRVYRGIQVLKNTCVYANV